MPYNKEMNQAKSQIITISLVVLVLAFHNLTFAQKNKNPYAFLITKCLGKEEELIHKEKVKGPIYHLNQRLLNVFLNLPRVKLKEKFYKEICTNIKIGTSLNFLELIFRNYENAFVYAALGDTTPINSRDREDFISRLPELFNDYLTVIKAESPTFDCLERKVPELKKFYEDLQYLEETINFKKLAQRDNQLVKIIDKLKNKDQYFEECKLKNNQQSK